MKIPNYAYKRTLGRLPFEQAEEKVIAALKVEGFGILTTIDVKATLKKKIDVDFPPYTILGACNPPLAHMALSQEQLVGLFMPCNVVLFEEEDGQLAVAIAKPEALFQPIDNKEVEPMVKELDQKVNRVLESLG